MLLQTNDGTKPMTMRKKLKRLRRMGMPDRVKIGD